MLKTINQYILNEELNIDTLEYYGFVQTIPKNKKDPIRYCYGTVLNDDALLYLEIKKYSDKLKFDDFFNVRVLRRDIKTCYEPFYGDEKSPELDNVISEYNEKMNDLVEAGILVKKEKEKNKKLVLNN